MSVTDYKKWSSDELEANLEEFGKEFKIDSQRRVVAPLLIIPPCGVCGSSHDGLYESEPSRARFNEGAVHYRVSCSDPECDKQRENVWDMFHFEAIHRFAIPNDFKLKDND